MSLRSLDARSGCSNTGGRTDGLHAGVAQLGQRRWDEVPVRNGSQVRILPPAPHRPLVALLTGENRSLLNRGFFEYGTSEAGMDHVADVGYVPLPDAMLNEMLGRLG